MPWSWGTPKEAPPGQLMERLIDGSAPWPDPIPAPGVAEAGELFYRKAEAVLHEEGRGRAGRYAGASVRVAGVRLYAGESIGAVSPELSPVSRGVLWLSDRRLVFIG